jgi:hypothetical protein
MNHHNIEPSLFSKGEYNGFDGRGYRWRVRKISAKSWRADPAVNHPGRFTAAAIIAPSLKSLAVTLSARQ